MEFIEGKYYLCTEDIISHSWLSSCCFIKGNSYKSINDKVLIDEYGSPIYFPNDCKDTELFQLNEGETI